MRAFDEYTAKFDKNNRMILRKYKHSYRVSKISEILAQKLKLDDNDVKLAALIGLLHDIGRFEQAKRYNTYNDLDSIDHGDFGASILFDEGLILNFTTKEDDYNIIKECVKGHNKYSIYKKHDKRTLMHLKIIRDADKLDILNSFANLNEYDLEFDGEVSKQVEEQFFSNKIIDNRLKRTKAEGIVGILSFVFDINFNESFEYICKEQFIFKIFNRIDNLDEKEKLRKYFDYAIDYVNKHK